MRAMGIILAGGKHKGLKDLTIKRAAAAMPIAGHFRAIDFALSNMTNSQIQTVAVLTQYNTRSLNEHLNSSKWWNFGRKHGGMYLFPPTITQDSQDWYRGTSDAIYQNLAFLKKTHEPYVVICSGDSVYKLDYNKVLDYHIEKGADITIVVKDMPADTDFSRFGTVKTDEDGRITGFEEKPIVTTSNTISCGIYIFRRRQLIELIERCKEEERSDLVRDIIIRYLPVKKTYAYKLDSYWAGINTVQSYYDTNMDFLKPDVRNFFFKEDPALFTKMMDVPPAKFNPQAIVRDSLIAGGSIINGIVENSVIFNQVYIGNRCRIKNSIILGDAYIGDDTYIENCIVESRSTIPANESYRGKGEPEIIIRKNDRYPL